MRERDSVDGERWRGRDGERGMRDEREREIDREREEKLRGRQQRERFDKEGKTGYYLLLSSTNE